MSTPQTLTPDELQRVKQRFSIIGNSPGLNRAIERAVKVAPIDLSVLVTGESGTGKEFFPKIIHQSGARKHKKYIAVNCGAIPEGTIDSELFGHEKGAFTGAINSRKGYFEEADGGTIFLDEVAELPLTTQARLLRVLETGEYLRVGSSVSQHADVRIVAATNVDLLKAVKEGKFREDLYYRLSTVTIEVPSLHDRGEDIVLLARKFAADFAEKHLTPPITFDEAARHAMMLYRWPGNVRQLKNIVEQLALFHSGETIDRTVMLEALPLDHSKMAQLTQRERPHDYESEREILWQLVMSMRAELDELRSRIPGADEDSRAPRIKPLLTMAEKHARTDTDYINVDDTEAEAAADEGDAPLTLEESEKATIIRALARNNGNRRDTARDLNINVRTLYRKIHDLGIDDN